ncbi:helix-turn-helix domain-containing protein [Streptomyces sp. WAC05374]|uniref:AraC family transcriptional regulator n=2 Tax=Streptomyces sp. WAC05374 TaxID=2487420 RepID=UPI00267CD12B|nr:helix-turn-helix domain-containing protein [Streptomyces sp. WAC05374]
MSSALIRMSVEAARLVRVPSHGYAQLLGLTPEHLNDDQCRIPSATGLRLAELTARHVSWPEQAMLLVQQSKLGALGVWDYLITAAPTPLEGIHDAADYFATVADVSTDRLEIAVDGGLVTISHLNQADMDHEAACAIRAYGLGLYRQRLSEAARRNLIPVKVTLAAKAPRCHDLLIELYGTRAITFEAPTSTITFLTADLTTPTVHAQPGLSTLLRRHADQTLATAIPLHSWLDLFRTTLSSVYDEATPTLGVVAQRMNLSVRTLQRRLSEHGSTWNGEIETLRRDHVTELLLHTTLSVDAIAARTGYADARTVHRAVQRWHGTTPITLRRTGLRS